MEGRGFMFPVDTAFGKDGRMHTVSRAWVNASSNLRVTMYDIESEYYGVYGEFGEGLGQFRWPAGITADSEGNIYMSDEQTQRINVYSGDGTALSNWGVFGTEEGQFNRPSGIDFDPENGDQYIRFSFAGSNAEVAEAAEALLADRINISAHLSTLGSDT